MTPAAIAMNGLLDAEYFDFDSRIVGDTFRIFVAKPPGIPGKHPAIYVADGNTLFAQVMGMQRMLVWGAEAPPAFVIGIGYPTEQGFLPAITKRNRDYVPTSGGEYAREVLRSNEAPGALAFAEFLQQELKPHITARYAVDPEDSTFVGVSLGGLFGAWSLLRGDSFQRYILTSPALWWNDEEIWAWEQACVESRRSLQATVFISAGGCEHGTALRDHALRIVANNPLLRPQVESTLAWHDAHGWPETVQLTQSFAERLRARNHANLRVHCRHMPDESHMSVAPAAICRGLRVVFDETSPS